MYEDINEPIEAAVHFQSGKANPLAFRWHKNLFKIKEVNLRYKFRKGSDVIYAYSVSSENEDAFKISFNPNQMSWTLDQICNT